MNNKDVDETGLAGQDFLAGVAAAWEAEASRAEAKVFVWCAAGSASSSADGAERWAKCFLFTSWEWAARSGAAGSGSPGSTPTILSPP